MNLNLSWTTSEGQLLLMLGLISCLAHAIIKFEFINMLATEYMFQAQLYTILELCRAFDKIFKEHLDGG